MKPEHVKPGMVFQDRYGEKSTIIAVYPDRHDGTITIRARRHKNNQHIYMSAGNFVEFLEHGIIKLIRNGLQRAGDRLEALYWRRINS